MEVGCGCGCGGVVTEQVPAGEAGRTFEGLRKIGCKRSAWLYLLTTLGVAGRGQGVGGWGRGRVVAPVAHQVILEPGIGQFREFESPRVHTRINSWGFFLAHKLTCGKRESVS